MMIQNVKNPIKTKKTEIINVSQEFSRSSFLKGRLKKCFLSGIAWMRGGGPCPKEKNIFFEVFPRWHILMEGVKMMKTGQVTEMLMIANLNQNMNFTQTWFSLMKCPRQRGLIGSSEAFLKQSSAGWEEKKDAGAFLFHIRSGSVLRIFYLDDFLDLFPRSIFCHSIPDSSYIWPQFLKQSSSKIWDPQY